MKIREDLIPLNGKVLNAINCDCLDLSREIKKIEEHTGKMAKHAQRLDEHEAAILYTTKQVHNIKNSASQAYMYIGIANMLLDNIKDDLATLYKERDKFCYEQAERLQNMANAERQAKHRRKEAAATE